MASLGAHFLAETSLGALRAQPRLASVRTRADEVMSVVGVSVYRPGAPTRNLDHFVHVGVTGAR